MNDEHEPASMADHFLFRVVEMFLQDEEPSKEEMVGLLQEIVIYLQAMYPHQNPTDNED
jgi:hypothetical protein